MRIFTPGWMRGFRSQRTTPPRHIDTSPTGVFGRPEHTQNAKPVTRNLSIPPADTKGSRRR